MNSCYLDILKTTSSEVHTVNLFSSRYTTHIPDLFFVMCFLSFFPAVQTCDKIYAFLLVCYGESRILAVCFVLNIIFLLFCLYWLETFAEESFATSRKFNFFTIVLVVLGLGPCLIVVRVLKRKFATKSDSTVHLKCHSIPVFHIEKDDMSLMRMYYLFAAVFKSIPQIYILSALILGRHVTGPLATLAQISLLVNVIIFSFAMAVTFPIRPYPRVYTESLCVLFNAFCKFMATFCSCVINILIFGMTFPRIGYSTFLIHSLRSILFIIPSWLVLQSRYNELDGLSFASFAFFLALIFNTIYIHPLEGKGKLIYYLFYLIKFFTELIFIFVLSDAHVHGVFTYFALEAVTLGYLSCYGLINILYKYKDDKCGCMVDWGFEREVPSLNEINSGKSSKPNTSQVTFQKTRPPSNNFKKDESTEVTNKSNNKEKKVISNCNDTETD